MEKLNIPVGLPNSKIINSLIAKENSKIDSDFEYLHYLEEIRKLISIEVSRINLLFPEYTPHDEQYHLKRLFYIADEMLGDSVIDNMNATELFLLSICLYAHDWGMAVSTEEKEYILSLNDEMPSTNLNLLDDEIKRVRLFCNNRNIELNKLGNDGWEEYVRQTHAFRSGKRIKNYFKTINSGIGEFASRICEGHWLDFNIIEDFISYPTDASINRDIVNVKALTVYVRLIDLLDLGEDRTPYILWKFVAPRNKISKLEWEKHKALQPVTFPSYQQFRLIQVEGSTDDQNVYMSIMDLKRYVDQQFRQCLDIINRINHSYHKLNISHIDWRVAARGFEPVAVQFEFERNRMFDILSDEIYQGNPYVFIRELVQNAVDAIYMRSEMLNKKDITFKPKIKIDIQEKNDFYITTISDNGIGMDEYIIRNYLSVAGRSYYRSEDFQKEGLKMDPISKFGIGILSCFMLAEYLEIETFKDPNTTYKQEYLKITIPAKENYFKIIKTTGTSEIGTKFKVFVIKKKLPLKKGSDQIIDFNITEYLKKTVGFVEIPIIITEKRIETIIHHCDSNSLVDKTIFRLNYDFPIENVILPQYFDIVKENFTEKKFLLREDLNLLDYNGCITFLIPNDSNVDFANDSHSWPTNEVKLVHYKSKLKETKRIRWNRRWSARHWLSARDEDYNIIDRYYNVYVDGFLFEDVSYPEIKGSSLDEGDEDSEEYVAGTLAEEFINPQIIVNIPKPKEMRIDLARTKINNSEQWYIPIWEAFFEYLKNNLVREILLKSLKERLIEIARLATYYKLNSKILFKYILEKDSFVLPFITHDSKLVLSESKQDLDTIYLFSSDYSTDCYSFLEANYIDYMTYNGILSRWKGNKTVLNLQNARYGKISAASIINLSNIISYFINENYYLSHIQFVTSTLGTNYPIVIEVHKLKSSQDHTPNKFINIRDFNIDEDNNYSYKLLTFLLEKEFKHFPTLVSFSEPYSNKFSYSFQYLNIKNPFVKSILKLCITIIRAKEEERIPKKIVGKLIDMVIELPFIKSDFENSNISFDEFNSKLSNLFSEAIKHNLILNDSNQIFNLSMHDFVDNSIEFSEEKNTFRKKFDFKKYLNGSEDWGYLIS